MSDESDDVCLKGYREEQRDVRSWSHIEKLAGNAVYVVLLEPQREIGCRHGSAPVVALANVATDTEEKRQAVGRLHALGHHPLAEPMN